MGRIVATSLGRVIDPVERAFRLIDFKDDILISGGAYRAQQAVSEAVYVKHSVIITVSDLSQGNDGLMLRIIYTGDRDIRFFFSADPGAVQEDEVAQINRNRNFGPTGSGAVVKNVSSITYEGDKTYINAGLPAYQTLDRTFQLAPSRGYLCYIENGSAGTLTGDLVFDFFRFPKGTIQYEAV